MVVHHKATAVHPAGIAAAQVHVDVGAVGAALIGPPLEVLLLVESNLKHRGKKKKKTPLGPFFYIYIYKGNTTKPLPKRICFFLFFWFFVNIKLFKA